MCLISIPFCFSAVKVSTANSNFSLNDCSNVIYLSVSVINAIAREQHGKMYIESVAVFTERLR